MTLPNRPSNSAARKCGPGVEMPEGKQDVLWTIRASDSVMRCVLFHETGFAELQVFQDDTLAISERLPDADAARAHADQLRDRLQARGWEKVG
jgi:hypothetical protein